MSSFGLPTFLHYMYIPQLYIQQEPAGKTQPSDNSMKQTRAMSLDDTITI